MKDSTKARLRIIVAGWAFIGVMALLMRLIRNSYILTIIGILGVLFLFALWMKYLQDYRNEK